MAVFASYHYKPAPDNDVPVTPRATTTSKLIATMTTRIKHLMIALAAMLLLAMPLNARDLTWSRYNLNFAVPEGGYEGWFNSATHYEMGWEDMQLTIDLFTQSSEKNVYKTTLERIARGYNMYDVKQGKIKVKDFKTYVLEGTMPDGSRGLLVNLVSKKSDLVVQITINYLYGNREAADDIVKSFAENPNQQPNHEQKRQKVKKPNKREQQAVEQSKKAREAAEKQRQQREKERQLQQQRRTGVLKDI